MLGRDGLAAIQQMVKEFFHDLTIALGIGIRQGGAFHGGQSQVVETYVSYLRRKLDPLGPPLIHTQRGVG